MRGLASEGEEVMAYYELGISENEAVGFCRYGLWEYSNGGEANIGGYSAPVTNVTHLWDRDDLETLEAEAKQMCDSYLDAGHNCRVYFRAKGGERLFIY